MTPRTQTLAGCEVRRCRASITKLRDAIRIISNSFVLILKEARDPQPFYETLSTGIGSAARVVSPIISKASDNTCFTGATACHRKELDFERYRSAAP